MSCVLPDTSPELDDTALGLYVIKLLVWSVMLNPYKKRSIRDHLHDAATFVELPHAFFGNVVYGGRRGVLPFIVEFAVGLWQLLAYSIIKFA